MKNRYLRLLPFLFGYLIAIISPVAYAGPFTGLVVFGDSLSDSGNNALVFDNVLGPPLPAGTLRTPVPIPGPDFVPTYPYASGRYTNGPVWAELLASGLGLAAAPSVAGGGNFAFGSARAGPELGTFPYSLADQTTMFLAQNGGRAPPGNLYVLQGGGDDARDAFELLTGGGDPTALISNYGTNMAALLARMEAAGADHILVLNVPDLGTAPAVRGLGPAAAAAATSLATGFNRALESSLSQLAASAANNVQLLDLFDLQQRIFSNPAAFGFSDLTSACAFSIACIADPAAFFWDGIHPTAGVHAVIGSAALASISLPTPLPIPLPGTGPLLGLGLLVLVLGRRLRQA
jgi:phospholipase/lecithinase/hemolysin